MSCGPLTVADVAGVVVENQGGGGEGDDHAEDAEEGAEDGEGEEDDGGVEAQFVAHDAGGDDVVADALADDVDEGALAHEGPEAGFSAE